jgi:uncharacterized DUF497 family protein
VRRCSTGHRHVLLSAVRLVGDKDVEHQPKHGVSFMDAQLAFLDPARVIAKDLSHSKREPRFYRFGETASGVLTVRFTCRRKVIRLMGAGYWRRGKKIYDAQKVVPPSTQIPARFACPRNGRDLESLPRFLSWRIASEQIALGTATKCVRNYVATSLSSLAPKPQTTGGNRALLSGSGLRACFSLTLRGRLISLRSEPVS